MYLAKLWRIALHGHNSEKNQQRALTTVAIFVHVCSLIWLGDFLLSPLLALFPDPRAATALQRWTSVSVLLALATGFMYTTELMSTQAAHFQLTGVFSLASIGMLRDSEELMQHIQTNHVLRVMTRTTVRASLKCICCGVLVFIRSEQCHSKSMGHTAVIATLLILGISHIMLPIMDILAFAHMGIFVVTNWIVSVLFVGKSLHMQLIGLFSVAVLIMAVWGLSLFITNRLLLHAISFVVCVLVPSLVSSFIPSH